MQLWHARLTVFTINGSKAKKQARLKQTANETGVTVHYENVRSAWSTDVQT